MPTGRTEWFGLPGSLARLFPGHEIYALPEEPVFRSQGGPYPGFTSSRVRANLPSETAEALIELATQEALGDRNGARPAVDLVVILDDLELANRDQPEVVIQVLRNAARTHLEALAQHASQSTLVRTAQALRERVSFHLIAPMIEAWFFADPKALRVAGVPAGTSPLLPRDAQEDFYTDDPAYLAATEQDCPGWLKKRRKKDRPKWLAAQQDRALHPKAYLQWLCREADAPGCTVYDEVDRGAAALKQLSWLEVLNKLGIFTAPAFPHLIALIEDVAYKLGQSIALPHQLRLLTSTSLGGRPQNHILRNL